MWQKDKEMLCYLCLLDTEEEKSKFEELYNQYRKLMYLCAKEILRDEQLAEDAVHEAFLKLTKYIGNISEVKCNKTKRFVVIVVECAAKDIWRKEKRREHLSWEEIDTQFEFSAEKSMRGYSEVGEAIAKLPLTYRQIFQMKYGFGYYNKEIADILKMREGTVRQRIARGKTLLQDILEEMEVHIGG